jgi:ubiquinone/menaquinone biosynthesis C-methylase UbiE
MNDLISPVNRTKAAARRNYNRMSRWYDWFSESSEAKYRQSGIQLLALQSGERVLEIGFGTGHCLLSLAELVSPHGWVCGIDISDGMAAVTQARLLGKGATFRFGLVLADGALPPFRTGSFDAIFMSFTLELFDTPEIPQVLSQCRRLLLPGGRLVVVTMGKSTSPGLAERIYEWFHARMPVAVDCRPINALPVLQTSGFSIDQVREASMWGLPVEIILASIEYI